MNRKKRTTIALSIVLATMLVVAVTYAYFTAEDTVENIFVIGNIDIDLDEPGWEPPDPDDLLPGSTLYKDPTVTSIPGSVDSYMRMVVEFRNLDSSKNPIAGNAGLITDPARLALILDTMWFDTTYAGVNAPGTNLIKGEKYTLETLQNMAGVLNPVNTAEFTPETTAAMQQTGRLIFNFDEIFSAGDTATLFSHIVIPSCYDSDDFAVLHGANGYAITVTAQAIQVSGFDTAAEAFEALHDRKYS